MPSTSGAGARIANIAPRDGKSCIMRARSAISRSPSSRLNTPATHAATYSPTLCPSTMAGRTPHDCHSSASAYSTANSAGWVWAVSSRRDACGPAR